METEAIALASEESILEARNPFTRECREARLAWQERRQAFWQRWGRSDVAVYRGIIERAAGAAAGKGVLT